MSEDELSFTPKDLPGLIKPHKYSVVVFCPSCERQVWATYMLGGKVLESWEEDSKLMIMGHTDSLQFLRCPMSGKAK